nr:site-specific integrase [Pandoraea horticolens]
MARGGSIFDPHDSTWTLREATTYDFHLRFDELPPMSPNFELAFKAIMVWYVENWSTSHSFGLFSMARKFFWFVHSESGQPLLEITGTHVLNFCPHFERKPWMLQFVSTLLKRWRAMGYAGVCADACRLFEQMHLKGCPKGRNVLTQDPVRGPLTAIELDALQAALNLEYEAGKVSLDDYVLCWLTMALGQRPTQFARLKVKDVVLLHEKDDVVTYSIRLPRAKMRHGNVRGEFKDRLLTPELGALVVKQSKAVIDRFNGALADPGEAPLFPRSCTDRVIPGFNFHLTAGMICQKVKNLLEGLCVMSERTGEPLRAGARRFRYTIGTRAAEEGHCELVIAELLDHSDTQNVGIYVQATSAIIDRIDRALAMHLAPLAQAFVGEIRNTPSGEAEVLKPERMIFAPSIVGSFDAIATCGRNGHCGFLKPIACYTCICFEPWADAPHDMVLKFLLDERERLMALGDARIAAVHDRTILAVAEVLQICQAMSGEGGRE